MHDAVGLDRVHALDKLLKRNLYRFAVFAMVVVGFISIWSTLIPGRRAWMPG